MLHGVWLLLAVHVAHPTLSGVWPEVNRGPMPSEVVIAVDAPATTVAHVQSLIKAVYLFLFGHAGIAICPLTGLLKGIRLCVK